MMSNLSERDQRTLRMGGIAAAAIVVLSVAVLPLQRKWNSVNDELKSTQRRIQEIQTSVVESAGALQTLANLQQVATVYPDSSQLNQQTALMLQQIEQLPGYRRLVIHRQEGLPLRDEKQFQRSGVALQFSGALGDLHQFLAQVGQSAPTLRVERLTLAANPQNPARVAGRIEIAAFAVVRQGTKTR